MPKFTHGRILNSVFRSVGQIGTSKGTPIEPTDSGGIGRSGIQGPGPTPPERAVEAVTTKSKVNAITIPTIRILIFRHRHPGLHILVKINTPNSST